MSDRHLHELERGVLLAWHALNGGLPTTREELTRLLYRRWWRAGGITDGRRGTRRRSPRALRVPLPREGGAADARSGPPPEPWRVWGPHWDVDLPAREDVLRIYLACAPHTALHVVAAVTERAGRWAEPWLLSTRALHQPVPTPDSTILSVPARSLAPLREEVRDLVSDVRPFLASQAPLLTLHVAAGVGIAQGPSDGSSFGLHRCGLVAGAVLATAAGRGPADPFRATLSAFNDARVDPRRPYRRTDASWQWHGEPAAA